MVLKIESFGREIWGKVVEIDFLLTLFRILVVDHLNSEQSEISLGILWWSDLPGNSIAGSKMEPFNLRGRNIDVVRSAEIAIHGRAKKAETIRHNLQNALGKHLSILCSLRFQKLKYELLFIEVAVFTNFELAGELVKLSHGMGFQIYNIHPHTPGLELEGKKVGKVLSKSK